MYVEAAPVAEDYIHMQTYRVFILRRGLGEFLV